jgi:hypothetical protein
MYIDVDDIDAENIFQWSMSRYWAHPHQMEKVRQNLNFLTIWTPLSTRLGDIDVGALAALGAFMHAINDWHALNASDELMPRNRPSRTVDEEMALKSWQQ